MSRPKMKTRIEEKQIVYLDSKLRSSPRQKGDCKDTLILAGIAELYLNNPITFTSTMLVIIIIYLFESAYYVYHVSCIVRKYTDVTIITLQSESAYSSVVCYKLITAVVL